MASTASFRYYPRVGWTSRITGGTVCGSMDGSTWTTLATISVQPPDSQWSVVNIAVDFTTYNYLAWFSPSAGYGNIAEVEFYDGTYGSGGNKIAPLYQVASFTGGGNPPNNAFDGNTSSFYEGSGASGQYIGIRRDTIPTGSFIRLHPRTGEEGRMVGAAFQGSNDFDGVTLTSGTWTTLASIGSTPPAGWNVITSSTPFGGFRYLRYYGGTNDFGNVAELEFYNGSTKITPVGTFGTAGSFGGGGNVYTKAFDGNVATFFDSAQTSNNIIGIDTGVVTPPAHKNLATMGIG